VTLITSGTAVDFRSFSAAIQKQWFDLTDSFRQMVLGFSLYFLVAPTSGRLNHPTSDRRKSVLYPSVARDQRVFSLMLTCWSLGITRVVKVRNEDYRKSHLNKSVYNINTNEPLNLFGLVALAGAGGSPWCSNV